MTALQILPISVSSLALVIAIRNYRRKSGLSIRGSFTISSSVDCSDPFVSNYVLENLKDRAATIFYVYLRVGFNYYIEIESFETNPLILKPFDSYSQTFGPIEFYGTNGYRVSMQGLLGNQRCKKKLVLSTSDGKYVVGSRLNRWNPVTEFFKNHATGILTTVRSTYKDTDLGSNVLYAVEFRFGDGTNLIKPIRPRDFELKIFPKFQLTKESLQSKTNLKHFLEKQRDEGRLNCQYLEVHDLEEHRTLAHEFYSGPTMTAPEVTWLEYWFLARFQTWWANRKMDKENERIRKASGATRAQKET